VRAEVKLAMNGIKSDGKKSPRLMPSVKYRYRSVSSPLISRLRFSLGAVDWGLKPGASPFDMLLMSCVGLVRQRKPN
jgi:hypothetical protein